MVPYKRTRTTRRTTSEVGLGLPERMMGGIMVDGPAEDMPGEIEEENREPLSAGAVVLLVKMGVAVGIERCDRAIATLTQLTNNYEDV